MSATSLSSLPSRVKDLEHQSILQAIATQVGHQGKAAEQLGLTRRMLRYRLKKYGIEPKAFKSKTREMDD